MKVKQLLTSSARWTRGCLAKNNAGKMVSPVDERACRWCLFGALHKCYPDESVGDIYTTLFNYIVGKYGCSISYFNDHSTFKDVIKVVKKLNI